MSQENVELAKAGVAAISEAYRTGEMAPWARHVEATFDPDVVLEAGGEVFTEGEWRGREGAVQFVANQMDVLENMWIRGDEFIDVADDCFVLLLTFGGHARHTGLDVENTVSHVFDLRDGRAVRWRIFRERREALEAAGLAEQAMSSENVGLVKTILSAAQTDWELASSKLDPDVRLDQSRFPDGGIYHGRAAFRDFYRRWFGTWDDLRITPERFFEAGDRVIAFITLEGRGKGSGTPVTLRAANVWTIRDAKVVELVGYPDRAEALEAVGLSE